MSDNRHRAYLVNRLNGKWYAIDAATGRTIHNQGGRYQCARIAIQKGYYFAY